MATVKTSAADRQAKLATRASALGWELQGTKAGYRLVEAATGTWVAAVWSADGGYGLSLDEIEVALQGA